MTEKQVVLVRDVLICAPDGSSVKRTETIKVDVEWPEGFKAREPDGYYEPSDWRMVGVR